MSDDAIAAYAADLIDLEAEIEAKQTAKKDVYANLRDTYGKKAAAALKLAIKRHRMDSDKRQAADELDTEAERFLAVIRKPRAPRATHVIASAVPHDADGVVLDDEEIGTKAPASKADRAVSAAEEINEIPAVVSPAQPNGEKPETPAVAPAVGESADNSEVVKAASAQTEPGEPAPSSNAGTEAVEDPATVCVQDSGVEGEGQAGATREHSSGELSQPLLPNGRVENTPDGPAVIVAAPISEPAAVASGAAEPGDRSAVVPAAAPVVAKPDFSRPNPICQDPEDCGIHASWNHTCGTCLRRKAQFEAAGVALQ